MTGAFPAQDALKKRVFSDVAALNAVLPAGSFVVAFFLHGVQVWQAEWTDLSHIGNTFAYAPLMYGPFLAEEIRATRERCIMPFESAFDDIAGLLKDFYADKTRPDWLTAERCNDALHRARRNRRRNFWSSRWRSLPARWPWPSCRATGPERSCVP